MRFELHTRPTLQLMAVLACMAAGALAAPVVVRLTRGPVPNWGCGESEPAAASGYLFDYQWAFVVSAVAVGVVLVFLSWMRGRLRSGSGGSASLATCWALVAAAVLVLVFLVVHTAFALYLVPLLILGVVVTKLGLVGGAAAAALVTVLVARHGGVDDTLLVRAAQVVGWCVLAAGLPLAFAATAPLGPILC
jgi:hypothetical protein